MSTHPRATHLLRPALFWALAHGLLVLFFFRGALGRALDSAPTAMRWMLGAGFVAQALFVGFVAFLCTLPLLAFRRRYAWAAPIAIGLFSTFFFLDSLVYESLGFHINRLVLSVVLQPGAISETGLPLSEVILLGVAGTLALLADVWLGSFVLRRFASGKRVWVLSLGILGFWLVDRVGAATLTFFGGQGVQAAATTLPMQPPLRMNSLLGKITGQEPVADLKLAATPQAGSPAGQLSPSDVHFTRKPDVLFILIESLRADFFTPEVMPNLSRRAAEGRVFTRHYASASATHFSLFSLFFGLDAQRRDATIGAGHSPLLFPAFKQNGYALSLIAASSVDWMGLKESVFGDVGDGLQTDFTGRGHVRDVQMMEKAEAVLASTPKDQPLFLFLFFDGTHFNYSYPERSAVFEPAWDGKGSIAAARVDGQLLKNRAQNSAIEVDKKLEEFLTSYEEKRGSRPLIVITGDHGEEFREYGRVGHGSDVTSLQLHVPMVVIDENLPAGTSEMVTGHVDVVPTLFSLLGDQNDPGLFSDGLPMGQAPADRYILATVGWEPRFALIGKDLKVRFFSQDAGLGSVIVTDPDDNPLDDGKDRFRAEAPRLLRRLRGGGAELTNR